MRPAARLRRTYFDSRYGQLHVHQAIPPGGGFDEAVPVLCLPGAEGRGRFFQALLAPLGADRSIYAPDPPGRGESDGTVDGNGAEQCALACLDLLDSLRQRQVDVIAHAEGAEAAVALARMRPGLVRRIVLSSAQPEVVRQVRALGLECRELPLGNAANGDLEPALVGTQLDEMIRFFGAAKVPA